jgi:hypothetical protein
MVVRGSMLVDIPTCRQLVRAEQPSWLTPVYVCFLAVSWIVVFGLSRNTVLGFALLILILVTARDMVILARTLWIMHPGNSYWRYEIDDDELRVLNLRGRTVYSRRRFTVMRDAGACWRLYTEFGTACVAIPKAAFAPSDQFAVATFLKTRRSPTVAA